MVPRHASAAAIEELDFDAGIVAPARRKMGTAWLLRQKVVSVMAEREAARKLEGRVEMDDAVMGGEQSELDGGKRRRAGPNKTPFVVAVETTDDGRPRHLLLLVVETHDGATTLFAALDVRTGLVVGECLPRHRAKEFLRFLRKIDRATKKGLDLHLVLDNYATHKPPQVKGWLAKHPRFHLHFTPKGASCMNLVERFFAEITTKRIRRGVFRSVGELEDAIRDYLDQHNADPKPFVWTKTAFVAASLVSISPK
jgi:transposase